MSPEVIPPSLWSNPDWYESLIAVTILILTIAGTLIKVFIVNPLKSNTEDSMERLKKIEEDVNTMSSDLRNISVSLASLNESLSNAHHRINTADERIMRLENTFIFNKE